MPITPEMIAGLASGGSNIIDVGLNAAMTASANRKSRKWQEKMYGVQRQDALADWKMQNEYNAPSAQMERFKAAGLNPNLIYGQQTTGAVVRSSSPGSYHAEAPKSNIGAGVAQGIETYQNLSMLKLQKDMTDSNIKVNNARINQIMADTIVKGSQKGLIDTTTAARAFKLGLDKSLVGVTVDTASANLDKLRAEKDRIVTDTFYKMHEDIRRTMLTNATIKQKLQSVAMMIAQTEATQHGSRLTGERMKLIAQQIDNLEKSGGLIELEKQLKSGEIDLQLLKSVMPNIIWPAR